MQHVKSHFPRFPTLGWIIKMCWGQPEMTELTLTYVLHCGTQWADFTVLWQDYLKSFILGSWLRLAKFTLLINDDVCVSVFGKSQTCHIWAGEQAKLGLRLFQFIFSIRRTCQPVTTYTSWFIHHLPWNHAEVWLPLNCYYTSNSLVEWVHCYPGMYIIADAVCLTMNKCWHCIALTWAETRSLPHRSLA